MLCLLALDTGDSPEATMRRLGRSQVRASWQFSAGTEGFTDTQGFFLRSLGMAICQAESLKPDKQSSQGLHTIQAAPLSLRRQSWACSFSCHAQVRQGCPGCHFFLWHTGRWNLGAQQSSHGPSCQQKSGCSAKAATAVVLHCTPAHKMRWWP